jgi:tetratricopeptide (TPR) repeat protein
VARGTQHRKRRPPANARVAAQPAARAKQRRKQPEWHDQLFFGRLRNHAKWVFVVLAAIFALSFVVFGVGSGSSGISNAFQSVFGGTSATGSSLASLEKQTVDHPKLASAWLAYGNKLEQKGRDDDAAAALTTYSTLKPKDEDVLRQLAGIYLRRAQDWNTLYTDAQVRAQAITPSSPFAPKSGTKLGDALSSVDDPLAAAAGQQDSSTASTAYTKVIGYLGQRLEAYKKLVKLEPKDAVTQLSLAQAASDASDAATAIAGYKAFLELAPTDSQAPAARKALKALEAQQHSATGTAKVGK